MHYDLEALADIIKKKKNDFLISVTVGLATMMICIALAISNSDTTYRFVFAVCALISLWYVVKAVKRYNPAVIFRKEIRGINIREDEFVNLYRGPSSQNYRILYPSQARGKRVRGRVYLKHDDGSVSVVEDVFKAQTDVYEIGDELYRPAGTVYPIITSRLTERQPCPLCGRINSSSETECISCSLPIINDKM